MGGDYRSTPSYEQGFLGVDWDVDPTAGRTGSPGSCDGDVWSADRELAAGATRAATCAPATRSSRSTASPSRPTGPRRRCWSTRPVRRSSSPSGAAADQVNTLRVRPLKAEAAGCGYREWVDANRELVHERGGGRVGYLHVPDMTAWGYAEFHRGLLAEFDREALVVDVRYNRGGHVSGLLLEKLARRRLAYDFARWQEPTPYPDEAPRGPMVMLTNEHAGSDGDIVSHAFKLLGLGPLIGRRTWGGVVGIWPRHKLADGTDTTQPEFAFAFDDVGWGVENYGTDPDIEVDNRPQDYVKGVDPQLDRGIEEALAILERTPAHTPSKPPIPRMQRPRLSR